MLDIKQSQRFSEWLTSLPDPIAQAQIAARILRMRHGHFGDHKQITAKLGELRIHSGPGYRLYFTRSGKTLIILLCGGDKSTQKRDIAAALSMMEAL